MLEHPDSPFIRVLGLLYLRMGLASYKELWAWCAPPPAASTTRHHLPQRAPCSRGRCEPYLGDKEEFMIDGTPATKTSFGEFVRRVLTDQDYFGDR